MTGPEHYTQGERHILYAAAVEMDEHDRFAVERYHLDMAKAHFAAAQVALAAETAVVAGTLSVGQQDAWKAAVEPQEATA